MVLSYQYCHHSDFFAFIPLVGVEVAGGKAVVGTGLDVGLQLAVLLASVSARKGHSEMKQLTSLKHQPYGKYLNINS